MVVFAPFVTQLHIIALTTERFIAIKFPLRYHSLMTRKARWALILAPWLFGGLQSFIPLGFFLKSGCGPYDVWPVPLSLYVSRKVVLVTLITIVNGTMYVIIWKEARKQIMKITQLAPSSQQQESGVRKIDKASRMILIVVVLFYALWLPYLLNQIAEVCGVHSGFALELSLLLLGLTNCILNNFLYGIFSKDFRAAYMEMLCCCKGNNP